MRTVATLDTIDVEVNGVIVRRLTIDCPHGTTTGDLVGGDASRVDVVRALAARHETEERCGCVLPLLAAGARA